MTDLTKDKDALAVWAQTMIDEMHIDPAEEIGYPPVAISMGEATMLATVLKGPPLIETLNSALSWLP